MKKTITIKDKYTVHVHLELRENKDGKPVFSCCVDCNRLHTHGQGFDIINPHMKNSTLWRVLYKLWKKHHLNDMHAGTRKQDNFLRLEGLEDAQYDEKISALKASGLLVDNGYKYGTGWLYREIPSDELALIKAFIES